MNTASNPLWEFSIATYARDGVAAACLALQDRRGIDVNLLLYAAWLAQQHLLLNTEHLQEMDDAVRHWRERVVTPLRALRRQWRDYAQAQALRERLKALELAAEQEQQNLMYQLYLSRPPLHAAGSLLLDNLRCVVLACGGLSASADEELAHLSELISAE